MVVKKTSLVVAVIFLFISCKKDTVTEKKLSEIENSLGIESSSQSSADRLIVISETIKERLPVNKYAFCAYQNDTVNLGAYYRANFVLASSESNDNSFLVLNYNGSQDTIPFDKNLSVYDVSVRAADVGINTYSGFIYNVRDSSKYPFDMGFYVE